MEIIDSVLGAAPADSIFVKTVNPISSGCLLYKVVHEICEKFNFSAYNSDKIKDKIMEQIV